MFVQRRITQRSSSAPHGHMMCWMRRADGFVSSRLLCRDDVNSRGTAWSTLRRVQRTVLIRAIHTSRRSRCSSSLPRCHLIHYERGHEGLRGADQWQMAPARQSHQIQRRHHPRTTSHSRQLKTRIEETLSRNVQNVPVRPEDKLVGVSRATRVSMR